MSGCALLPDHGEMRFLLRSSVAAAILLGGLALSPSVNAAETDWTVLRLQPLAEGDEVQVNDLNDSGTSVGESGAVPVTWDASGEPTELELPEGCHSFGGRAISDSGHIAGAGFCEEGGFVAIHWSPDGEADIASAPGYQLEGVDEAGISVGFALEESDEGNQPQAMVYLEGQPVLELPDGGAEQSIAFDLTSWGYVVGAVGGVPGIPQDVAVGWFGTQVFPLVSTGLNTAAYGVTEQGVALVGTYDDDFESQRGFLVAPGRGPVALQSGGDADVVRDLNDLAIVVGTRITGDVQDGRFYLAGTSISLTDAVSDDDAAEFGLTRPTGINDSAWVVGYEEDGSGWLLKPPAAA